MIVFKSKLTDGTFGNVEDCLDYATFAALNANESDLTLEEAKKNADESLTSYEVSDTFFQRGRKKKGVNYGFKKSE